VADVVNHVRYEDLRDVVLLGFSYGGMVVTGSLEHLGDRVRHLVYLDAFVPRDGESVMTLLGRSAPRLPGVGEPWQLEGPPRAYEDPAEEAFSTARRTPQPLGTFTEPVRSARPLEEWPFPRTYVRALLPDPGGAPDPAFAAAAEHARSSPAWRYREIATSHLVAQNRPRELADLLLELA
jgi:pimeloyl-ACP methyl ester carboxylesterase